MTRAHKSNESKGLTRISQRVIRAGFTLIEVLTVVLIMSILMGLVLGVYPLVIRMSQESKTKAEMEHIGNALQGYQLDNGSYPKPGAADGTPVDAVGVLDTGATAVTNWMKAGFDFKDSWGNPYRYTRVSQYTYRLQSYGHDGKPGTGDDLQAGR